jgi:hypothetical protein
MGTGRFDLGLGSAGTQTAALGAGGFINTSGRSTATEEYDGTSWAGGGSLPVGIYEHSVFGTQTAGVINNGTTAPAPGGVNTTLEYNGSTWHQVEILLLQVFPEVEQERYQRVKQLVQELVLLLLQLTLKIMMELLGLQEQIFSEQYKIQQLEEHKQLL